MSWWIGTWHDMGGATNAATVEAATEREAALAIAEDLQTVEEENGSSETVDGVFVAPWDGRVAYRTRTAVERAELQCCGGEAPGYVDSAPHWATCPERPEGTGQGHGLDAPDAAAPPPVGTREQGRNDG